MNIIGISGLNNSVIFKQKKFPHLSSREHLITQGSNSAAAIVTKEGVMGAVAEERFTGIKATESFPVHSIRYCLEATNLKLEEIDYLAHGFCYEPLKGFYQHSDLMKEQFKEVYSREAQINCLEKHFPDYDWNKKFLQVPHHLAHAASTFYLSGFTESLILVIDGMGEQQSTTIAVGKDNQIKIIKEIESLHSLGILYGVFTLYLGFDFGLDEYKVMGLAPYGNARRYYNQMMELVHLHDDGTYTIPILFQNETEEEKETYSGTIKILTEKLGLPREPRSEITQQHMDIAAALQLVLQNSILHILRHFKRETGQENLCMAGGVALNCTANGVIHRSRLFKKMFIQPAAGDDGTALGAALYIQRFHQPELNFGKISLPLWGSQYSNEEIATTLNQKPELESKFVTDDQELAENVAQLLAEGKVIAWFQGRMEFGPRALGNRSILADPRVPNMRDKINSLVKKRESFRPFAPAVAVEKASQFFDLSSGAESVAAYMLLTTQVKRKYREQLPAITHVDGSARVQTVSKSDNPKFWTLINEFEKLTQVPILLNTSFNVKGQPIVRTPVQAIDTFIIAKLDALVMGNYIVNRID